MNNRRGTARHDAGEIRIWLGRWVSRHEFQTLAARIENISQGGAKILTNCPPGEAQKVWLRVGTPTCMDCVQATVLQVQDVGRGDFMARLVFDAPCPPRLLEAVIRSGVPAPHFRMSPSKERGSKEKSHCAAS